jgi:hypothetical protein
LFPGVVLALCLGIAAETHLAAASESGAQEILPRFNALCDQLAEGRGALQGGRISEDAFVDLVLDLFTQADSLSQLLSARMPATRGYSPASALARGLRYFKSSLRGNYEGIAGGNGYSFVKADLDFKAALAWRNDATGVALVTP